MGTFTFNFVADTENPADVLILSILGKAIRFEQVPAPEAEVVKAAKKASQTVAKPTKAPEKAPVKAAEPAKTPEPAPTTKSIEKMDFAELCEFIPLQRKVTKDHALFLGKAYKVKENGEMAAINAVFDKLEISHFKEIKDYKKFCEMLIAEVKEDVGI